MSPAKYDEESTKQAILGSSSAPDLVTELRDQAYAPFRAAARLSDSDDVRTATNARTLLAYGLEAALVPMTEKRVEDPLLRSQMFGAVTAAAGDLKKRVRAFLKSQMTDRALIPVPEAMQYAEPPPIPRRVCDHAFLTMRRLLHHDEDVIVRMVDERLFENLPADKKDAIIADALRTERWIRPREEYLLPQTTEKR